MDTKVKRSFLSYSGIFLLVLFIQMQSSAQDKLLRRVSIKEGGYYHLLYVDYANEELKIDNKLTYYWFDNGKIFKNRGGFSGQLLQGLYEKTTYSGKLIESGNFMNGIKDGIWKKWDSEGNFIEIENWKKGLKDGKTTYFRPDSDEKIVSEFKDGKLNGWVIEYKNDSVTNRTKYRKGEEIDKKGFLFFKKKRKKIDDSNINNAPEQDT